MTTLDAGNKWAGKQIFTTGEVAEVCKVSQQTIIRCFDSGRLEGFRVPGSKFRRIPRAALMKFMRDSDIPLENLEGGLKRILAINEDAKILEMFQDIFGRDSRFDFHQATSIYDAGIMTERSRPHLVIVDHLPGVLDGELVCRNIRKQGVLSHTKIVVMCGPLDSRVRQSLSDAGADELLEKPFSVQHLLNRIPVLLGSPTAS